MGHPWEGPGLKHLAVIVVSLCRQFSPAWAAIFRHTGDLRCRLFIAWVKLFLFIFCINADSLVL